MLLFLLHVASTHGWASYLEDMCSTPLAVGQSLMGHAAEHDSEGAMISFERNGVALKCNSSMYYPGETISAHIQYTVNDQLDSERLVAFYERNDPTKIDQVSRILKKRPSKRERRGMYIMLARKYPSDGDMAVLAGSSTDAEHVLELGGAAAVFDEQSDEQGCMGRRIAPRQAHTIASVTVLATAEGDLELSAAWADSYGIVHLPASCSLRPGARDSEL